ncbi:hypothetical protein F4782DRAFT_536385 [Xylaria castorea]|nr:hypothetical protein F4782DRAFT_536385 [Xylaria castorea]
MPSPVETFPKLSHVLQMRVNLGENAVIAGQSRGGATQHLIPLNSGFVKGVEGTKAAGLEVELVPGGSDWLMVNEKTKMNHLDIRTHGENQDGDGFFVRYVGYMGMDEMATKYVTGVPGRQTTKGGDNYWYINPIFETSSEKYRWLTTTFFVGRGHWYAGDDGTHAAEYEIFEVTG